MPIYRVPVRIDLTSLPSPAFNIWHVRTAVTEEGTAFLENALGALAAFYESAKGAYPTGAIITVGEGVIKDPLGTPEHVTDHSTTINGSGTTGILSPLLAISIGWRSTIATRSGRGRTFIGPLCGATDEQHTGRPNSAYIVTLQSCVDGLVDDSTTQNGWAVGVLSQKDGVFRDYVNGRVNGSRYAELRSRRD